MFCRLPPNSIAAGCSLCLYWRGRQERVRKGARNRSASRLMDLSVCTVDTSPNSHHDLLWSQITLLPSRYYGEISIDSMRHPSAPIAERPRPALPRRAPVPLQVGGPPPKRQTQRFAGDERGQREALHPDRPRSPAREFEQLLRRRRPLHKLPLLLRPQRRHVDRQHRRQQQPRHAVPRYPDHRQSHQQREPRARQVNLTTGNPRRIARRPLPTRRSGIGRYSDSRPRSAGSANRGRMPPVPPRQEEITGRRCGAAAGGARYQSRRSRAALFCRYMGSSRGPRPAPPRYPADLPRFRTLAWIVP